MKVKDKTLNVKVPRLTDTIKKQSSLRDEISATFDNLSLRDEIASQWVVPGKASKPAPSNLRILIAVGMALGCGLTLLFELIFGG